jgi:hypothetical protein
MLLFDCVILDGNTNIVRHFELHLSDLRHVLTSNITPLINTKKLA